MLLLPPLKQSAPFSLLTGKWKKYIFFGKVLKLTYEIRKKHNIDMSTTMVDVMFHCPVAYPFVHLGNYSQFC